MVSAKNLPFLVSIPHSGERVPSEVTWLVGLSEPHLMRDVDRYVDKLYESVIADLEIESVVTPWHRYVVDLNRLPGDFDATAVQGAAHPSGTHPKGLHWSVTTHGEPLIASPMSNELHLQLLKNYYQPFHDQVKETSLKKRDSAGRVFHLDLHSMPSKGTQFHPDPGQTRADVVISDFHGQSSLPEFRDLVLKAFQNTGLSVAYNWPYIGGGITQMYGRPESGHSTVQVELNRALYMNEQTKKSEPDLFASLQQQLGEAMSVVISGIQDL